MSWFVYYRGPLSSCNYSCNYCPFSKTTNSKKELIDDFEKLKRFTEWVLYHKKNMRILFTPWGEALIHRPYQQALVQLSNCPRVEEVAIQTNLATNFTWHSDANPQKLSLWATYHPTEVDRQRFLDKCNQLTNDSIAYSVGIVGKREHFDAIQWFRQNLPSSTYLWVNAYNNDPEYYQADEIKMLTECDPWFPVNIKNYESYGSPCFAGESAFTVDGNGDARRCHFISKVIGNIYDEGFENNLTPRTCSIKSCRCHIGYIHLKKLGLYETFGKRLAGRIPSEFINSQAFNSAR